MGEDLPDHSLVPGVGGWKPPERAGCGPQAKTPRTEWMLLVAAVNSGFAQ